MQQSLTRRGGPIRRDSMLAPLNNRNAGAGITDTKTRLRQQAEQPFYPWPRETYRKSAEPIAVPLFVKDFLSVRPAWGCRKLAAPSAPIFPSCFDAATGGAVSADCLFRPVLLSAKWRCAGLLPACSGEWRRWRPECCQPCVECRAGPY